MIKYPNGKKYSPSKNKSRLSKIETSFSASNRGMNLEEDINISNEFYRAHKIALIEKRPTPINVVHVDYENNARITDAYFEKQSTTDYSGIYKEKYIDFEAKSTNSKTSFPLKNIPTHQIDHLCEVNEYGGIVFFIINFEKLHKTFILLLSDLVSFIKENTSKSIPLEFFENKCQIIKQGYSPRLYYLEALDLLLESKK